MQQARTLSRSHSQTGSLKQLYPTMAGEDGGSHSRNRSLSPSAAGRTRGLASVASVPALDVLSASASSGRVLVPSASVSALALHTARDRSDHAAHSALLAGFSRILSAGELHNVAAQAPRLHVATAAGVAVAAAPSSIHAVGSGSHSQRGSMHRGRQRRRGPSHSPTTTVDSAAPVSAAQVVANARQQGAALGRERSTQVYPAAARVPSHLRSMLSVRPTVTAAETRASVAPRAAVALAPPPALDPAIASYLASLHTAPSGSAGAHASSQLHHPSKPTAAAGADSFSSPRKHKARAAQHS